ncbi:hypothetical protein D3C78_1179190 [compost metagenome]
MRPEQPLRAEDGEVGLRVGHRQLLDHLFTGGFAARKLVGIARGAEVFGNVAMVMVIEVDRRRRDMDKLRNAVGRCPLAQATGSAHVGQFEGFFGAPWRGEAGTVPQHVHIGQHGLGLR